MNGYRLNDKDIDMMVNWLKAHHPENANEKYAASFLVGMKLSYRSLGWSDPDKLEDYYIEFDSRESDQKGKTSDD